MAGLVDWALSSALAFGLYLVLYVGLYALGLEGVETATQDSRGLTIVLVAVLLAPWLYFAMLESSPLQGPIGKSLLGLRVVTRGGSRITFGHATVRHFAKVGFLLIAGYLLVAVGSPLAIGLGVLLTLTLPSRLSAHNALTRTAVRKESSGSL